MPNSNRCNIQWEKKTFKCDEDVYNLLEDCNTCKERDQAYDYWDDYYKENPYYQYETYILTDSRRPGKYEFGPLVLTHEPFYVGHGKKGRHVESMALGRQLDKYCFKVKRMIEIIESGGVIRPVVVGWYYTKKKAELVEKKLMNTIPKSYLENSSLFLCEIPLKKEDCNAMISYKGRLNNGLLTI
jgi:hypothetical protein